MSVMPLKVEAETNVISIGDLGFLCLPVILCSFQSISKEKKKKQKTTEIQIQNSLDVIWKLFDLLHWL